MVTLLRRRTSVSLSTDQRGIVRAAVLGLAFSAAMLTAGYRWLPPELLGLDQTMDVGEQIAFALKADLLIFIWLAGCMRSVSKGRFHSPADIRGSAFGMPSPAIAVRSAVLQNSLEQTVLAIGGHLILAAVLRGPELVLIPLLVLLYLIGRVTFAAGYAKGPAGRAFGMVVTAAPTFAAYALAAALTIAGR